MIPAEKDALNREFHELLGKHLHEGTHKDDPKHPDRICTRCGVKITERNYADDVLDYAADPRLVLREMMKREDWDSFCDYIGYLDFSEDGYPLRYVRMDYILDITGKLRDAAIEFLKEATDENKFYKTT